MTSSITVRSPGAILLGAVCALGTAVVLFWHVRETGLTTNHIMVALALLVTLGSGHLLWSSAELSIPGAVRFMAFLALFAAGTAVCVTLSAGRGAEFIHDKAGLAVLENGKRTVKEAEVLEANTDRKSAKAAYEKALTDAKVAREAAAAECATGRRLRCEGRLASEKAADEEAERRRKAADQAESHYWVLVAQLGDMKPAQVANVDLRQAAKVIAFVWQVDVDKAYEGFELLWPYLLALITEFGTIAFLNYGFGHRKVEVREERLQLALEPATVLEAETVSTPVSQPEPKPLAPGLAAAVDALSNKPLSNKQLARRLKIAKSTASKRVSDLEAADLVTRERDAKDGREVKISLKPDALDKLVRVH